MPHSSRSHAFAAEAGGTRFDRTRCEGTEGFQALPLKLKILNDRKRDKNSINSSVALPSRAKVRFDRIRSQTRHKRYEFNSFKLVMNYSWRKWSCNSFSKPLTTYISRPSIANDVGNCKPSPRYYVYCCPYFYLNTLTSLPNNVLFRYGSKARNISFPTDL